MPQVVDMYDAKEEAAQGGRGAGGDSREACMVQLVRDLANYVCSLSYYDVMRLLDSEDEWGPCPHGHTREQLRALLTTKGRLSAGEGQWARAWCYGACPSKTRGSRRVWCADVLSGARRSARRGRCSSPGSTWPPAPRRALPCATALPPARPAARV